MLGRKRKKRTKERGEEIDKRERGKKTIKEKENKKEKLTCYLNWGRSAKN